MRVIFEPLIVAAKVDLVFAGHVHAYERSVSCCLLSPYFQFPPNLLGSSLHLRIGSHAFLAVLSRSYEDFLFFKFLFFGDLHMQCSSLI